MKNVYVVIHTTTNCGESDQTDIVNIYSNIDKCVTEFESFANQLISDNRLKPNDYELTMNGINSDLYFEVDDSCETHSLSIIEKSVID